MIRVAICAAVGKFFVRGSVWLLFYVILTLALALYTPVMRTCLMILTCHPLYQCEFPECWRAIDQKFAASVYLSGLMALPYGVGFPLGFYKVLCDRYIVLGGIFLPPLYR